MDSISKKKLNSIIKLLCGQPGWVTHIGNTFGWRAERYAEYYHDEKLKQIKQTEKHWYNDRKRVRKDINKMIDEIGHKFADLSRGDITPVMIDRAREADISNLIDVNPGGFALCIDHEDTVPSMYCKNNFVYCFSCGYAGDAIDVMMKTRCVNFQRAVELLQRA